MRDLRELDRYRTECPLPYDRDPSKGGAFKVQTKRRSFLALASVDDDGHGGKLEHISISHRNEKVYPTWDELCEIKDMFFLPEETCVQFFPKKSEYVNLRKNCFHIWRPVDGTLYIDV